MCIERTDDDISFENVYSIVVFYVFILWAGFDDFQTLTV